jgi:hypothetical protein
MDGRYPSQCKNSSMSNLSTSIWLFKPLQYGYLSLFNVKIDFISQRALMGGLKKTHQFAQMYSKVKKCLRPIIDLSIITLKFLLL